VTARYLNHPALTLGYRLVADGVTVVYSCDHEPYLHSLAVEPDAAGNVIRGSTVFGHLAVAVPGTVSGLEMALAKYGTMKRAELIAPAIRYAEQGFVLEQGDADLFGVATEAFKIDPATAAIFLNKGRPFVAGDRQTDGVFPLWSIARNMSLAWLAGLRSRGLIRVADERAQVELWRSRLGLVTPDVTLPVLSLSGGNQQKVLFARALGSAASLVLMDDPMRGVDVGTKRDVYELIASEARAGRGFVWYTTEFEELHHCDRVYVFNNGRISGELTRAELSEERVLQLSFEDAIA